MIAADANVEPTVRRDEELTTSVYPSNRASIRALSTVVTSDAGICTNIGDLSGVFGFQLLLVVLCDLAKVLDAQRRFTDQRSHTGASAKGASSQQEIK